MGAAGCSPTLPPERYDPVPIPKEENTDHQIRDGIYQVGNLAVLAFEQEAGPGKETRPQYGAQS